MSGNLYKTKLLSISHVLLYLLIISINLREPFFHSREILFFLFVATSFIYGDYKKLFSTLLLLALWGISLIYNVIVPGSNAISGTWYQGMIISCYLFLLVFSNSKYQETIIKAFIASAIIVSLITIVLWLICFLIPPIGKSLSLYFEMLHESTDLSFIGVGTRMILGVQFFMVWYRTIPIVIPALGYCYIKRIKGEKTKINALLILMFSVALVFSGTRANMLTAFLLLAFTLFFSLLQKKCFGTAITIIIITLGLGALASIAFLNDKGSRSSSIKHLHQVSYFKTFGTDYIRTVFFGWGYGSSFYSEGRKTFVDVTELSHWETIRKYGFIPTVFIMLFIWLRSLISYAINDKSILKYYYAIIVLAYIFVACTNPYLLDSLGFCVLLFFDAFFDLEKKGKNVLLHKEHEHKLLSYLFKVKANEIYVK